MLKFCRATIERISGAWHAGVMAQATGLAGYWGSSSMFFLVFSFDSLSRKIVTQFFYDSLHVKGSHDTGVVKVRKGYDKDPGVILRTWHIFAVEFSKQWR